MLLAWHLSPWEYDAAPYHYRLEMWTHWMFRITRQNAANEKQRLEAEMRNRMKSASAGSRTPRPTPRGRR
jgi:hypothetical protein